MAYKNKTDRDEYAKKYRLLNRADLTAKNRVWRQNNPDKRKALRKRHYEKYREREIKKAQAWYAENRGRASLVWKMKKYGLSKAQVLSITSKLCALCSRPATQIDHCHVTGAVREGLCKRHNVGLGMFDDDPSCLKKAIAYLMKHKKKS